MVLSSYLLIRSHDRHETKGVNHVDYYPHADKPYLLTTSDDRTVLDQDTYIPVASTRYANIGLGQNLRLHDQILDRYPGGAHE